MVKPQPIRTAIYWHNSAICCLFSRFARIWWLRCTYYEQIHIYSKHSNQRFFFNVSCQRVCEWCTCWNENIGNILIIFIRWYVNHGCWVQRIERQRTVRRIFYSIDQENQVNNSFCRWYLVLLELQFGGICLEWSRMKLKMKSTINWAFFIIFHLRYWCQLLYLINSEKWCQSISDILKESKICQKNKSEIEGKFRNGLIAKWNTGVADPWDAHQFDEKLAELRKRKKRAAGKTTNAW